MGNRRFYAEQDDGWATPCCGIQMWGDIIENKTVCPYCEKVFEFEQEDGEEPPMNRQVRCKGAYDWTSYGVITFVGAAERYCSEHLSNLDRCCVEVRDEYEPDTIREFTVERRITFVVTNPRQGE